MKRRRLRTRAQWRDTEKTWLSSPGVRDFAGGTVEKYTPFKLNYLPELVEPPSYSIGSDQAFQMSWRDLSPLLFGLQAPAFDVSSLTVQWQKNQLTRLSLHQHAARDPFAILGRQPRRYRWHRPGHHIGICYWAIAALLEAMGGIGQLPPMLSAWSPDLVFFFLGTYFS